MAVKRSQNWINQQRVDVPHLRSIESAVRNDFDELFAAFVLGESNSYVIRGFEIEMAGSIGASANGLQLIVEDSAILHGASNEAGTFFELPPGETNQVLSATTNTRVEGAFTPGALNYVSVEFTRTVDDSTTSQLYLWNPTTQNEITKTLPLAETFDYKIIISSSVFTSNVLPLAIVQTDGSNNVLAIQDRRPMLFRLGTAGADTPDPFYEYGWDNHAEGRSENFWSSSNSTVSPFRGGDKQIRTFKENDEALKTELKQIKGTTYWYSPNNAGSLTGIRYDLGNTIFTGRGSIEHNNGNPGQINWDEDMFLTVVTTRLRYNLEANAASTDIDLEDGQVAYVTLIRGVDVIPQLIFTNGADEVTSVGAITWTTDLEAGDYVKVGSEPDSGYYQIASVDSPSQVTLTQNFEGTSTGINGTDAKIAYGNYRTDPSPSTDRHIYVADIEDVPFDADVYWLFLRSDSGGQARVYLRFLNAELEVGEQIQISDQVPAALLAYIGSANDSDSDPAYATLATGVIAGSSNYNSVDGENLTIRASKLTSMMADKAQDKTIKILSNHTSVSNTENGGDPSYQDITFSGGTGTATVAMPSSANNGTIGLGSTLELANNQAAYFSVDRNAAFNLADLDSLTVSDIDSVPLDENTFIFAYRLGTKTVYLWDGTVLEEGSSIALSVLRGYVQQNKTVKLVKGGTWSWDSVANELTNSAAAYIQVGGLAENVNEIAAQTISLPNDGSCAYVTLKRSAGASVLTVNVADIDSVPVDDHTFIVARRTNDEVIVGTNSFALENRDYLTLDGAKAEIDRRLDQLKVNPAQPLSTRIVISASDILQLNGSKLSLEQRNLLLQFDGAQIDFNTGEVFEADGVTPLLGGANDFTPATIPASEYFYYSVSVLPSTANADNTISGQILVIPATGSDAALANAPKAPFPGTGIKLANIYVQRNAGDTAIENINFENIISLGVGGSGSGGSGDATSDETAYRDRLSLSPYEYANMNIASQDEDDQLDGSSTATFDIPTGNFKFADSTAQTLISTQQLDEDFLAEGLDLPNVEVFSIWDLESIDTAATYEVSRDGGASWQAVTMSRIGNSDSYRGYHEFTEEPSNAFNQEYAVANADDLQVFDDSANQWVSQKFTVVNTTVYKDVLAYISKDDVDAVGRFCLEIVADDAGAPSTDINDSIWVSEAQNIGDLSVGNNVIQVSSAFVLTPGDYHLIIKPDTEYQAEYTNDNSHSISARIDSSAGPTPNLRTYDGSVWSAEVADSTMVYRLEGRELDLRIRITSSATADDKFLSSYALFYKNETGVEFTNPTFRELFSFDGTVDNDNEFTLTNFLPDSRLLFVFARGTGQTFRYGDFVIDGHTVTFPENTFNVSGTVELEFFQIAAVDGVTSSVADALLAASHLGSTDASIDKSVAGRGIILRNAAGQLVEVGLDEFNNLTFTVV